MKKITFSVKINKLIKRFYNYSSPRIKEAVTNKACTLFGNNIMRYSDLPYLVY